MQEKTYIAIDLKSFYASVECSEAGLDPLDVNLVVADPSRTNKTICLAVSPALKSFGVPGRPRLFEVEQIVKEANALRRQNTPFKKLNGKSYYLSELKKNRELEIDYVVATPRMALYIRYSTQIYQIYLQYVAAEDMHVYSVDEVFLDVSHYLKMYKCTAEQLARTIIQDIFSKTGITATAGIGTNLYLAKVAMDIVAKHLPPDENGVRIASLTEGEYRRKLWAHTPITDFWRVGKGYERKLKQIGINTMGDIARCSLGAQNEYYNEDLLYKLFGVNAELLIDHAWGWEPCTMQEIKSYRPESTSLSQGQVLHHAYTVKECRLIVKEMCDALCLELVEKKLNTKQIVLEIGYDAQSVTKDFKGEVTVDRYGRKIPTHAHGTANLPVNCSSAKIVTAKTLALYDKITNPKLLVRRVNVTACDLKKDGIASEAIQLSLFPSEEEKVDETQLQKEKNVQNALVDIKRKYGKNSIVKGMNMEEGGTAMERNGQIGGHKA